MRRLDENPLLRPEDVAPTRDDLVVLCTLNPAAVRVGDEVLLLVRIGERPVDEPGYVSYLYYDRDTGRESVGRIRQDDPDLGVIDTRKYTYRGKTLLTSMSHLRIARSRDGQHFTFDPAPAIFPATSYEAYGCEDARITTLDDPLTESPLSGRHLITYTAVSDRGVAVALATTDDFVTFRREGVIFPPYQKDVVIFPERVPCGDHGDGLYVCRHRPYMTEFNDACIWTAYSPDLLSWGRHDMTLAPTANAWHADRVGAGGVPIRTDAGWLEIYHGCDGQRYALGAMLSDLEHPERVLSCSSRPVLLPEADYEREGVFANTVFANGTIVSDDGTLTVYYGAGDRVCAAVETSVDAMIAAARR
ncbi:MAG: glycoside hydrolase family 130 protein [Phycisphaerae bacterium]|nr:glycoside hydrolase family 130 protein [Phycisphaerae bacterium]